MEIVARIKDGPNDRKQYHVMLTETEIDKITGIAGKPHQTGRYVRGMSLNISKIYNRVKTIVTNHAAIKAAMQETRTKAQEIDESLPLIDEP